MRRVEKKHLPELGGYQWKKYQKKSFTNVIINSASVCLWSMRAMPLSIFKGSIFFFSSVRTKLLGAACRATYLTYLKFHQQFPPFDLSISIPTLFQSKRIELIRLLYHLIIANLLRPTLHLFSLAGWAPASSLAFLHHSTPIFFVHRDSSISPNPKAGEQQYAKRAKRHPPRIPGPKCCAHALALHQLHLSKCPGGMTVNVNN